jgi:Holliday junction resolvasome RuvABC endonuclease subunit
MGNYYMGIDPSTVSTGYAVIDEQGRLITYGLINPNEDDNHIDKLAYQWSMIRQLLLDHCPVAIVCEDQYQGPNVATLIKIARTSAALMIAAGDRGIPVTMMYPAEWRKIYHGRGDVVKKDTLNLVNESHGLKLRVKDNDIADAIGMAHACLLVACGIYEKPKKKVVKKKRVHKKSGGLSDEDLSK